METLIIVSLQLLGILSLASVVYLIYAFFQAQRKRPINKKLVWISVVILSAYVLLTIASMVIISSVATSSLNDARKKANEAGLKANLSSLWPAALLYFDTNKSYDGFCDDTESLATFKANLTSEEQKNYVCNGSVGQWAVSIPIRNGVHLCIDSTLSQPIEIKSALKDQTVCQ